MLLLFLVGVRRARGTAGLVVGGDKSAHRAVGGDTAGGEGIVVGGTSAVGFVVGGDGRAG